MTRADIIRMAREAGIETVLPAPLGQVESIERFAALVAAAEREACAMVCETVPLEHPGRADMTSIQLAAAIRARGRA